MQKIVKKRFMQYDMVEIEELIWIKNNLQNLLPTTVSPI